MTSRRRGPESTRIINLLRFADVETIDPMYVERPFYLAPDGKVAASAFAVLRDALVGKAGIGKLALLGREYLVAVQPRENGLMMFTLRQARELRRMSAIEELDDLPETVNADEVKLARQVIGNFAGDLDPVGVHRRLPGGAAPDHRFEDRRRRGGRPRVGDARQGGQPDGRAPQEPRTGERRQEETGEGGREVGGGEGVSQARRARGNQDAGEPLPPASGSVRDTQYALSG